MTSPDDNRRRRTTAAVTAVVTILAVVGGILALTLSPSSPTVSPASAAETTPSSAANPLDGPAPEPSPTATPTTSAGSISEVRNVVLILADDLDTALFNQVPRLAALRDRGMSMLNQTVTDSLCCPSRVSIMRGQYIHNHRVLSNIKASGGGWPTFRNRNEHTDCLPVWLSSAGVTTGLFGKYLNEYPETPRSARYVPPGWDEWDVPVSRGDAYSGYDYTLNSNGRLYQYGKKPGDFLNDVITDKAVHFIENAPEGFFAQLSTFSPHKPAPVAARHKATHLATTAPRTPNYNTVGTNEPSWLTSRKPLTARQQAGLDALWRQRAQSAESVADSVDAVLAALERSGRSDDTLVVITADNGYHAGVHRLPKGKRTAFREDSVVPMVVLGPGIVPGSTFEGMTSTIDLAPTFTELLGATAPGWVDGRSLKSILETGAMPATWRTATLSESLGVSTPDDPDYQPSAPPQFSALRTPQWLFVVYKNGERELYDLVNDPYEMNNIVATADPSLVASLYTQVQMLNACSGPTCRQADALAIPAVPATPSAPNATDSATPTPTPSAGA